MEQKEILQSKLIAEFDGWVKYKERKLDDDLYTHPIRNITFFHKADVNFKLHFKYHESFDWLVPVCRKFDMLYDDNWTKKQRKEFEYLSNKMDEAATLYEIIPLYKALLNGIKWYNTLKNNQ